jgi:hypothetical protein
MKVGDPPRQRSASPASVRPCVFLGGHVVRELSQPIVAHSQGSLLESLADQRETCCPRDSVEKKHAYHSPSSDSDSSTSSASTSSSSSSSSSSFQAHVNSIPHKQLKRLIKELKEEKRSAKQLRRK